MLRVTLDINGSIIGQLSIVRDKDTPGRVRSYTMQPILPGNKLAEEKWRVEDFDSDKGAWALAAEAIGAGPRQRPMSERHWEALAQLVESVSEGGKETERLEAEYGDG